MPISEWPATERPRERLLQHGARALSDAELVAIFVHTGCAGRTALDVAREALTNSGGLPGLLDLRESELCSVRGLGPSKFVLLQAALELGRRYLEGQLRAGKPLTGPDDSRRYLQACLRGHTQEVFGALFLDNRHRVIRFEELFKGTINGASVYPREVVKRALELNAAALIVAHNHPSGVAEPSAADQALTHRLRDALTLVDIRLLDHIVVGHAEAVSLADRGLL